MKDPVTKLAVAFIAGILLIFLVLVLTACTCHGQHFKKHIAPAALILVAGAFEGAADHLQFHYDGNSQFWQPDISWRNKYKGRNPANGKTFAGKYFVAATDGWHLMKFGRNATLFAGVVLRIGEKQRWYWRIAEGLAYWAVNRAGFNLSYHLLNK